MKDDDNMNQFDVPHEDQSATASDKNKRVYGFLDSHPIGVIATVDPNNDPHAAVIYYSLDENFNVLFVTKRDTKKHDNLKRHNRAIIVVYDALTQATVQIRGTVEDVSDTPQANEAFRGALDAAMRTSEEGIPPISKLHAGYYVGYKLKPAQIRMAVFARPDSGDYEELYETIDF